MRIVFIGDNLHEVSNSTFWENITKLLSAALAQGVVKDKQNLSTSGSVKVIAHGM